MTAPSYLLAIDQGTTGTAALLFDAEGRLVASADRDLPQHYPQPGWVEHDPEEVWATTVAAVREALQRARVAASRVAALGITNQRETTLLWERATGRPVARAVVWQCRRTAPLCEELKRRGLEPAVREKTGLPIDAYFSATKVRWLLDHTPQGQRRAEAGDLCAGTVDAWLLWRLTGGRVHATDTTNASRTMLYNIHTLEWDADLLAALDIPAAVLPRVVPSSGVIGETDPALFGAAIPIAGAAGDQHAALFGQACFAPGSGKNTYGTGCFLLQHTGARPVTSRHGLLTTVAWRLGETVEYALEGSVFIAGAALQWLRDGLGLLHHYAETEPLARSVADTAGVYLVPAFTGLGAPYWDMYARGAILGLTRGTTRAHLVRAALEAQAYQVRDVAEAVRADTGLPLPTLRADGGGSANAFLMQFQADLLGVPVERAAVQETTALGAAFLAGLAVGVWRSREEVAARWRADARFEPRMAEAERQRLYASWRRAVERARGWAQP